MLTVTDVDTIMLEGLDKLDEWEREFQLNFNAPLVQATMVQGLLELGPLAAQGFKQMDRQRFDKLANHIDWMAGNGAMGNRMMPPPMQGHGSRALQGGEDVPQQL